MHVKLSASSLPEWEQSLGADSHGGIVITVNGTQRTWTDLNTGPRTVTLAALRDDDWFTHFDASQSFDAPFTFALPATVPGGGEASGATVTLTLAGPTNAVCTYQAQSSHWNSSFTFVSCDGGQKAGDSVSATTLTLGLQSGSSRCRGGVATFTASGTGSAGDGQWTDIAFADPVPLFKGANAVSISGPGFGHSYDVYRRIDFAGGGTIAFATAPICQPDADLVGLCDKQNADIVFGPVTYVRADGPPQTATETFAGTDGGGVVCLQNGDGTGRMHASAATVSFNSAPLFDAVSLTTPSNELAEAVAIMPQNTLVTTLQSAPGTMVTLKVVREKVQNGPPRLNLSGCAATKVADTSGWSLFLPLCALFLLVRFSWRRLSRRSLAPVRHD